MLCCFALFVCLTLLASFFLLISHLKTCTCWVVCCVALPCYLFELNFVRSFLHISNMYKALLPPLRGRSFDLSPPITKTKIGCINKRAYMLHRASKYCSVSVSAYLDLDQGHSHRSGWSGWSGFHQTTFQDTENLIKNMYVHSFNPNPNHTCNMHYLQYNAYMYTMYMYIVYTCMYVHSFNPNPVLKVKSGTCTCTNNGYIYTYRPWPQCS